MLHYRELLQSLQSIGSHHSDTKEEPIFYHLNYYSIQILYLIKFLESNCFYRISLQTIYIIVSFIYIHVHSKWFFPSYTQSDFFHQCNQTVLPLLITLLTFYPFNAQKKQGIFTEHIKSKEPAGWAIYKLFTSPLSSEQQKRHIFLSAVKTAKADTSPNTKAQLSFLPNNSLTPRSLWVCSAPANRGNKCCLY